TVQPTARYPTARWPSGLVEQLLRSYALTGLIAALRLYGSAACAQTTGRLSRWPSQTDGQVKQTTERASERRERNQSNDQVIGRTDRHRPTDIIFIAIIDLMQHTCIDRKQVVSRRVI